MFCFLVSPSLPRPCTVYSFRLLTRVRRSPPRPTTTTTIARATRGGQEKRSNGGGGGGRRGAGVAAPKLPPLLPGQSPAPRRAAPSRAPYHRPAPAGSPFARLPFAAGLRYSGRRRVDALQNSSRRSSPPLNLPGRRRGRALRCGMKCPQDGGRRVD
jgi:hypothetical protein